jgi:hypothetical protein
VGATLALSGCYKYVPTRLDLTPVDERVRLVVSPAGATDLAAVGGVDGAVPTVEGRFAGLEDGTLLMRVPVGNGLMTPGAVSLDQMIRVPSEEIISIERREIDRARTGLLLAGALGGAVIVVLRIMEASGQRSDPPIDPDLYLFSIPIG